jgi:hypothetical protein
MGTLYFIKLPERLTMFFCRIIRLYHLLPGEGFCRMSQNLYVCEIVNPTARSSKLGILPRHLRHLEHLGLEPRKSK